MLPAHFQTAILAPTLVFVSAVVPVISVYGVSVIVWLLTSPLMLSAVTVIAPMLLVEIFFTYLEVAEADSPHPHPSVSGSEAPVEP